MDATNNDVVNAEHEQKSQQAQPQLRQKDEKYELVAYPPINIQQFSTLNPNRSMEESTINLYDVIVDEKDEAITCFTNKIPRYILTVIDRSIVTSSCSSKNRVVCATVLIPAGRETEYIFSSIQGLKDVAASAQNCIRLIAVQMSNRNYDYISTDMIQQELSYVVRVIAMRGSFLKNNRDIKKKRTGIAANEEKDEEEDGGSNFPIPFMAVDGMGERRIVMEGDSKATGPYFVEEAKVGSEGKIVRRLYFRRNEGVVQTEAYVHVAAATDTNDNSVETCISRPIRELDLAFEYHRRLAAGILHLSSILNHRDSKSNNNDDKKHQCDHRPEFMQHEGLVVGIGGGALVTFLNSLFKNQNKVEPKLLLTAIEIDPDVVRIAQECFGFKGSSSNMIVDNKNGIVGTAEEREDLKVIIGDGLNIIAIDDDHHQNDIHNTDNDVIATVINTDSNNIKFNRGVFTFIVIDVDAKDVSSGMSCPPESFVTIQYLSMLRDLLLVPIAMDPITTTTTATANVNNNVTAAATVIANENNSETYDERRKGGILAINVSARDACMRESVVTNMVQVFGAENVYLSGGNDFNDDDNDENGDNDNELYCEDLNVVVFGTMNNKNKNKSSSTEKENSVLGSSYSLLPPSLFTTANTSKKNVMDFLSTNKEIDEDTIDEMGDYVSHIRRYDEQNKIDATKKGKKLIEETGSSSSKYIKKKGLRNNNASKKKNSNRKNKKKNKKKK